MPPTGEQRGQRDTTPARIAAAAPWRPPAPWPAGRRPRSARSPATISTAGQDPARAADHRWKGTRAGDGSRPGTARSHRLQRRHQVHRPGACGSAEGAGHALPGQHDRSRRDRLAGSMSSGAVSYRRSPLGDAGRPEGRRRIAVAGIAGAAPGGGEWRRRPESVTTRQSVDSHQRRRSDLDHFARRAADPTPRTSNTNATPLVPRRRVADEHLAHPAAIHRAEDGDHQPELGRP